MKVLTTSFSSTLDKTGVIEIRRKSERIVGFGTLGIGVIMAVFHCIGTYEQLRARLNRRVSGSAKTGAERRRNHEGSPSKPVEVGFR